MKLKKKKPQFDIIFLINDQILTIFLISISTNVWQSPRKTILKSEKNANKPFLINKTGKMFLKLKMLKKLGLKLEQKEKCTR